MRQRWRSGAAGVVALLALVSVPGPSSGLEAQRMAEGAVELDRVVAVVNGDVILESDVQEERRMEVFQPFRETAGAFSRTEAIDRLIDRTLILQQAALQQEDAITEQEVRAQVDALRRELPACSRYRCETEDGWARFVGDQGFTVEEFTERWRKRMEVLAFIELRFKRGIHITSAEVQRYYDGVMLPEYAKAKVPAPGMEVLSGRIEEVLLQQRVSALLEEWLKTLRAQGTVRLLQAEGEAR